MSQNSRRPNDQRSEQKVSFIVPVRIESSDRRENLRIILDFLSKSFCKIEILIVEEAQVSQIDSPLLARHSSQIRHVLSCNAGKFAKSAAVNLGIRHSTGDVICIYDADVLIAPEAIEQGAALLRSGLAGTVTPYNGIVLDLNQATSKTQLPDSWKMLRSVQTASKIGSGSIRVLEGGVFMTLYTSIVVCGGFNANMRSYGWEDTEVIRRMGKLGFINYRLKNYNLIHLYHSRGPDSSIGTDYNLNHEEYKKVMGMRTDELVEYVQNNLSQDLIPISERTAQLLQEKARLSDIARARGQVNRIETFLSIYGWRGIIQQRLLPLMKKIRG